jgi:hypothetical protein
VSDLRHSKADVRHDRLSPRQKPLYAVGLPMKSSGPETAGLNIGSDIGSALYASLACGVTSKINRGGPTTHDSRH